MLSKFEKILESYDYEVPSGLIAQTPVHPRDAAKLLVYDRKNNSVRVDIFKNIIHYLPKGAVLIFNQTKVLPARLILKKESGGGVKMLFIGTLNGVIRGLINKNCIIGARVVLNPKIYFTVTGKEDGEYTLKPSFPIKKMYEILARYGETPIPPYIKHSPLNEVELRREYQTVFAKENGSVAAPTAALHFTKSLIAHLRRSGFDIKFLTLHVNLGTFASLKEENFLKGKLHTEFFKIDPQTAGFLNKAKKERRPIVAVGTTAARALESASDDGGCLVRLADATDLFIREAYKFKFIDALITNFHVPKSSLLMMVSAFTGSREKLLALYARAIQNKFRFFSFGDGMFIK